MADRNSKKGFDFDPIDLTGLLPEASSSADTAPSAVKKVPIATESLSSLEHDQKVDRIVDSLFQKMKKKGDFPSFSRQIIEVNKILKLKYSSARDIANVIMKDFSLSNKLLKLVNSSFYGQFSKNGISSISSAMIILGADQIQQAAAGLMLFEQMQANAQSELLKEVTVRTFMSGLMAKDVAELSRFGDTEEFQICSMFHSLGENLIAFYFPEKYQRIIEISHRRGFDLSKASQKVLAISFHELGLGVAKKWGLPKNILQSMDCDPVKSPPTLGFKPKREDYLGYISVFSNTLSRIYQDPSANLRGPAIEALLSHFKGLLNINIEDMDGILNRVSDKIKTHATQLNIDIKKSRILANIAKDSGKTSESSPEPSVKKSESSREKSNPEEVRKRIYNDIRRIEGLFRHDFALSDILLDILDVMHREFDYTRIAICIRDAGKNQVAVRHGLGKDIDAFIREFNFPFSHQKDIFHLCMSREKDYSITNIEDSRFKALIPGWYRMLNMAEAFDLYALVIDHIPIGFFYADREQSSEYAFLEEQKNMKKLRNLAEKAIRTKKRQNAG